MSAGAMSHPARPCGLRLQYHLRLKSAVPPESDTPYNGTSVSALSSLPLNPASPAFTPCASQSSTMPPGEAVDRDSRCTRRAKPAPNNPRARRRGQAGKRGSEARGTWVANGAGAAGGERRVHRKDTPAPEAAASPAQSPTALAQEDFPHLASTGYNPPPPL